MGMWNNMTSRMEDSAADSMRVLDSVKAVVHATSSLATGYFCYLIVVTVRHTHELRSKASFLLLCQHCTCIAAFNATGCILHFVRASRVPAPRLFCWLVFDLQVVAARGAMMNLTLMALNACLSVLQPLHYRALVRCIQRPVMVGVWLLALLSPVLFTVLAGARLGWEGALALEAECSTALEGWAARLSSLALLGLLVLLIILSNALLTMESCRAGHFNRSNRRLRRTALIHALQMSFHILPGVVIISRVRLGLFARVLNFLVFSVAQSASPVVYGLRCRDLWDYLPRFLPRWALRLRSWYHTLSAGNSTSNSTSYGTSNNTSNNTNSGPATDTTLISRNSDDSTDVIHIMTVNAGEEGVGGRDSMGPGEDEAGEEAVGGRVSMGPGEHEAGEEAVGGRGSMGPGEDKAGEEAVGGRVSMGPGEHEAGEEAVGGRGSMGPGEDEAGEEAVGGRVSMGPGEDEAGEEAVGGRVSVGPGELEAGEEAVGGRVSVGPGPVQARPALGARQEGETHTETHELDVF